VRLFVPVASAQSPRYDDLKKFFAESVAEEGIVGAGMYIVSPSGVIDSAFAGYADQDSGRKTNGATIWHWASITKTFTAIAIMQLRDHGRLSVDDPILKYVPELSEVHNRFGSMSQVTIRQLLSHSAGFRSGTWPWGGDKPWHPFEPTKWSQLVAMMPYTEIEFQPGSKFQYSNPGYVFLGETIARLAGEDFEVYMQKNVLSPLGMTHSYYDITPYHLIGDRSNNYYVKDGKAIANGLDFDTGSRRRTADSMRRSRTWRSTCDSCSADRREDGKTGSIRFLAPPSRRCGSRSCLLGVPRRGRVRSGWDTSSPSILMATG
jgi:CubicO group peptidase (beta-lactamase class C family)